MVGVLSESIALLASKALTKTHSLILIAIVTIAAVVGGTFYLFFDGKEENSENIRIGFLADLDGINGGNAWEGAKLAVEQINEEGGVLGRKFELIEEDSDEETIPQDPVKISSALTKLITVKNVDFIVSQASIEAGFVEQEIIAEHKKVLIAFQGQVDALTQNVLDNYDKYKYFFKYLGWNATSASQGMTDGLLLLRENLGFNKVGYLAEDLLWNKGIRDAFDNHLEDLYGFDVVYKGVFPIGTIDFSSYFAAAEAADTEVLVTLIAGNNGGIAVTKEYYDRQSPIFIYGGMMLGANAPESWDWTEGKCNFICVSALPIMAGYPLTSETLPAREAFISRWGETPGPWAAGAYDILRFVLPDAINRAGTIETEAVINALEETSIETSLAENFVFTESHDLMMGENPNDPDADYMMIMLFQWQNGEQVPLYPKKIMEEAGASYMFPDWSGPWDDLN
jgi:branched-chain amino acid transport system substrate-binding protein